MQIDFVDGSTLQGGDGEMNKSVDVSKPLAKIVTTIANDEELIYSIEWFFRDDSYQRIGVESPAFAGGRSQTIEFERSSSAQDCTTKAITPMALSGSRGGKLSEPTDKGRFANNPGSDELTTTEKRTT